MLETARVVDPRAAAVFSAPRQRKILLALVPEERSLSQLSRLTETPLNLLHHHVRKLLGLGLVTLVREEQRAGAPIKYYRAKARAFFVPAELLRVVPGAGLSAQLRELLDENLARTLQGAVFSHDAKGPRLRLVREEDPQTVATELWLDLRLTRADARRLLNDLRTVLHRYEARSNKSLARYLVHAAIAEV